MLIDPNVIQKVIQEVADKFLRDRAIEMDLSASGAFINSIEVRVFRNSAQIWAIDYTTYIASGRGSGTPPPIQPLLQWVEYRFAYEDEATRRGIAYAVQHKIGKEGTKTYQDGGNDLITHLGSKEVEDFIAEKINGYMINYVSNTLLGMATKILK